MGPLGMLALIGMRRKSAALRGALFVVVLGIISTAAIGCSSSPAQQQAASQTPTPASTSQVTITATSGSVTQSVQVALTVM